MDVRTRSLLWLVATAVALAVLAWEIGPDIGLLGGFALVATAACAFKTGAATRAVDEEAGR